MKTTVHRTTGILALAGALAVGACGGEGGEAASGEGADTLAAGTASTPDSACQELVAVAPDSMEATGSGLRVLQLAEGEGRAAAPGDTVRAHYVGCLTDGTKFDASADHGEPISFVLGTGKVIQGWDEGLEGMAPGGERLLRIPPEIGYGSEGGGPIPPDATLLFQVRMVEVTPGTGTGG